MDDLITRAREYLKDKYLDVADVPKFIEAYVEYYERTRQLEAILEKRDRYPGRFGGDE